MASLGHGIPVTGAIALVCAVAAAAMIIGYLRRKPKLSFGTKIYLLFGLGVLPAAAAASSTAAGMQTTTERHFCGSCHVMERHVSDSNDPKSQSLAARHGRNPLFGGQNCYTCHADYSMFGYPITKLNGMRHVYEYYFGGYGQMTLDEAVSKIHIIKPYDNANCRHCHTGTLEDWSKVPDHASLARELASNRVSCASAGCHGYAHPFSKQPGTAASALSAARDAPPKPGASASSPHRVPAPGSASREPARRP